MGKIKRMKDPETLWAKSDGTTLKDHIGKLLENLKVLKDIYGDLIEKNLEQVRWEIPSLKISGPSILR